MKAIRKLRHWLFCHAAMSGGIIDHDKRGVFWKCSTCGRIAR